MHANHTYSYHRRKPAIVMASINLEDSKVSGVSWIERGSYSVRSLTLGMGKRQAPQEM